MKPAKIKPGSMAAILFPGKTHFQIHFEKSCLQDGTDCGCHMCPDAVEDSAVGKNTEDRRVS